MISDRVIEILIEAGMRNHPQIHLSLHGEQGECALGVLHLAVHNSREGAVACAIANFGGYECVENHFSLSSVEMEHIWKLNDGERLDFIGIARKLQVTS
mgnify:CR=1 FL=1